MRLRPGGRGEFITAAVVFVAVLAPLLHLRYGYQAGTNDHQVLSLQGLQWGRPGFLVEDWFVASAPQPHVLFDLVTWVGAAGGVLAETYLAWWMLGLAIGGVATAVLARAWTPRHPVLTAAVISGLIGLGPQLVLGSTSPALPSALPHQLGGFCAYLAIALLLTRRPRAAAMAVAATAAVHVQIGAIAAVVAVLAFVVVAVLDRRRWWSLLAGSVVAAGIVALILHLRPVAAAGDDFVEICREVIPYHCDAASWPLGQLLSGFAVMLAATLSVAYVARSGRGTIGLWVVAVLVPAVALAAGVMANRHGLPVAGELAAATNVFRLAVLLLPFGAWGLYAGFVRLTGWRRPAWLVAAGIAGYGWLVTPEGTPALPAAPGWAGAVLGLGAVAVLLRGSSARAGARVSAATAMSALGVLLVGAVGTGVLRPRPVELRFVPQRTYRAMGWLLAQHVPVGETVLVPPTLGVLRLTSGRAIVVDCKAVPYGGTAWHEYRERLEALGGRGSCHSGGRPFLEVSHQDLLATALRYHARYVLLPAHDRRVGPIVRQAGWTVVTSPYVRAGDVWLLAAPGASAAATWP